MNKAPQILRGLGGFFLFATASASVLQAANTWSIWDHLDLLVGRTIAVAQRDGACFSGSVTAVTSTSFLINPAWNQTVRGEFTGPATRFDLHRADVVRISEWWAPPSIADLVYSARSSWADVQQLEPVGREEISVHTVAGMEFRGKPHVTSDYIQFGNRLLQKTDIRTVDYLRYQPLKSSQQEVVHEEASWIDPRLWFNRWFVPLVQIRVYDQTKPEDNSAICNTK